MSNEKLSLDGLIFEATKVAIKDHILTITLNRPDKKNAINSVMKMSLIMLWHMQNKREKLES